MLKETTELQIKKHLKENQDRDISFRDKQSLHYDRRQASKLRDSVHDKIMRSYGIDDDQQQVDLVNSLWNNQYKMKLSSKGKLVLENEDDDNWSIDPG